MKIDTPPTYYQNRTRRVGGLLIVFCLIFIVLDPIFTSLGIVKTFNLLDPYFADTPELLVLWVFITVVNSILICSGIFVCFSLLRKRIYAVSFAKKFLIAYFITATAICFISIVALRDIVKGDAGNIVIKSVLAGEIKSLVLFVFWYSYLRNSKRIKETFSGVVNEGFITLNINQIAPKDAPKEPEPFIAVDPIMPATAPAEIKEEVENRVEEEKIEPAELIKKSYSQLEALPPAKRSIKKQ